MNGTVHQQCLDYPVTRLQSGQSGSAQNTVIHRGWELQWLFMYLTGKGLDCTGMSKSPVRDSSWVLGKLKTVLSAILFYFLSSVSRIGSELRGWPNCSHRHLQKKKVTELNFGDSLTYCVRFVLFLSPSPHKSLKFLSSNLDLKPAVCSP